MIGATVSEYLWADLTPCEFPAVLLSVETRLPAAVVDPAWGSFRLRPTWVCVSAGVDSLAVCRAVRRFGYRLCSGTHRVSQVPDASLRAYHALKWTPANLRGSHQIDPSAWASDTVNIVAIRIKRHIGAVSSFGDRGLSCGLRTSLCTLQLTCSVFPPPQLQLQHSVGVDG